LTGVVDCSLIADTRQSAAAALNASNAYKSITDAINRAWNASTDAVNAANEAKTVRYTCHVRLSVCLSVRPSVCAGSLATG